MIIWGRKTVRRHVGYVADFCPICACARPFAVTRVGSAGHLYFISVGDGTLVGHERACKVCSIALRADPAQYMAMAKQPLGILELIQQTFPNFKKVHGDRLAFEAAIRANPHSLAPEDRQSLLMAPFVLLSPKVSQHFESIHLDGGRAFIKREVLPILARALRRLRPSRDELADILTRLKQLREVIGSKVRLDDLMAAIAAPSGTAPGATGAPSPAAGDDTAAFVGAEAGARLTAGRVMRIAAWIGGASIAAMALAIALGRDDPERSTGTLIGLLIFVGALCYGLYRVGWAVSQGRTWGRVAGIVIGVVSLAGFPIGTALGGYLLFVLALKWSDNPA